MSWYSLRLLGSFQFTIGGDPAAFRSGKERALLAYLAVEDSRPHTRDALAGLLWSDLPEDTAHNNLRVTLHRLRQVLGGPGAAQPLIEVSRQAIHLAQNGHLWTDVQAFRELLARADGHPHEKLATCPQCMAWFADAAALYRGEFLHGVYPADSLLFSEWALLKREHLQGQAVQALFLLAAYHQRRGELDQALGYARRQLELEPWREEAHCQVMTILALRGERTSALRHYKRCRQMLRQELGVEPAEETRTLYQRILASRNRSRHGLPVGATPFLGRSTELNQLNEYLANPDCRLLTILGPGGIGKSRLALQAAEAQVFIYLDGVFLVQLEGVATQIDLLRSIAAALELRFRPARDPKPQLLDYLREKEMLLVLDNYEGLLGSVRPAEAAILEELLESAPGLRLIVTSRHRLNLNRERVFGLQGLSISADVIDKGWEKSEAVQLFLHCARRSNPGFHLNREDRPPVARICQFLEGMPLAIELAASWTRLMSPGEIVQEIESNLDFLGNSYPDLPERQRSLRATYEHSYHLLSPKEQQVLSRLAIFPASFERAAAEQVAEASLAVLTSLRDRSLLEPVRSKNRGDHLRYRMHELIRQFSGEKLSQDPVEAERVKDRHCSFYMRFLNERSPQVMGGMTSYQAGEDVSREIENVRPALERAIDEGRLTELFNSLNILMYFYEIQGLFEEAEGVFRNIVRRMEAGIQSGQLASEQAGYYLGRALMYHGWYCMQLARFDQAIELTREGLVMCRGSGDLEGYGLGLNSLGVFARAQGKHQQAKNYLLEALEVLPEDKYPWSRAGVLGNLGTIASIDGDLSLGAELFQQSLDLSTRLDDEWSMAIMLGALGKIALRQGDLSLAEKLQLQGIKIRQKLGQHWRIADSLNNLGDVAYRRQRYLEASRHYQDSLAILRNYGDRVRIAATLVRYAEVCIALGENEQARESLLTSFKIAKDIGADGTIVRALLAMAMLLAKEGEGEQAVEILAAISEHPSLEHDDKTKAGNLLTETQAVLPPSVFQTALEKGKTLALEDLRRSFYFSTRKRSMINASRPEV